MLSGNQRTKISFQRRNPILEMADPLPMLFQNNLLNVIKFLFYHSETFINIIETLINAIETPLHHHSQLINDGVLFCSLFYHTAECRQYYPINFPKATRSS